MTPTATDHPLRACHMPVARGLGVRRHDLGLCAADAGGTHSYPSTKPGRRLGSGTRPAPPPRRSREAGALPSWIPRCRPRRLDRTGWHQQEHGVCRPQDARAAQRSTFNWFEPTVEPNRSPSSVTRDERRSASVWRVWVRREGCPRDRRRGLVSRGRACGGPRRRVRG